MIESGWDKRRGAAFAAATRTRKKMVAFASVTKRMIKVTGRKKAPGLEMKDLG